MYNDLYNDSRPTSLPPNPLRHTPSVLAHSMLTPSSVSEWACCFMRFRIICRRAGASGRGMKSLFTSRRLAASSISCGLHAMYLVHKKVQVREWRAGVRQKISEITATLQWHNYIFMFTCLWHQWREYVHLNLWWLHPQRPQQIIFRPDGIFVLNTLSLNKITFSGDNG